MQPDHLTEQTTAGGLDLVQIGKAAKAAARVLASTPTRVKNEALRRMASRLEADSALLLRANRLDLDAAQRNGLSEAMLDRLALDENRLAALADDLRHVATLPDPVGEEFDSRVLDNGMRLKKRRVPLGVLGVIYEARPNVTVDVASLCLKTGNAVILRGGSETIRSNEALTSTLQRALVDVELPETAVQLIASTDRRYVSELLRLEKYVDMIVPRGGEALHRLCRQESTIPVITGGMGICHLYVDDSADLPRALDVIENAKVQRPSVCNALDTLLVHRAVATEILPGLSRRLAASGVTLHADPDALALLKDVPEGAPVRPGESDDFDREWLSLDLGVRLVDSLRAAIDHIHEHGTGHSDGILTKNLEHATRFVDEVDSAAVYVNASTRFTDGGQFGLGAEVAVSTQKLHARGPMGLRELTTYKWIGIGDGHIRS